MRRYRKIPGAIIVPAVLAATGGLISSSCAEGPAPTTAGSGSQASRAAPPASAAEQPSDTLTGTVESGGSAPQARLGCPADMALVSGHFCPVLRYACKNYTDSANYRCSEYLRGQRCLGESDYRRYCIDRHEWPNKLGEKPRVYVTWIEAKELCRSVDKRLCRRSEWTLACEGPKRLPYPWGFARQPSPCNIDRPAIPFDAMALERQETREEELARLWQADPIGSHPDCISAFGVYDMSGNVDEWTDNELDNPNTPRPSTLNGGYWGPVRDTCRLTTKSHGPKFRFYQVGFRCCRDTMDDVFVPEPRPWIEAEKPYKQKR